MRRLRSILLALIAVAALPVPTEAASQHPNTARGFDIGKPYQMNGLDNVNLFNGNLTITIPIGQRYPVNGKLSYALTLVYSGNLWDIDTVQPITCGGSTAFVTKTYPNRRSNAGMGWLLSLGRLFPPNQAPVLENPFWSYETPDGSLHDFHPRPHDSTNGDGVHWYSRDGSYLRMTLAGNVRTVEFPDGTSHVFKELQPAPNAVWGPVAGTGVWRLVEINDRFANRITVQYSSTSEYSEIWTIDDTLRIQTVYFKPVTGGPYLQLLDKVTLKTFNLSESTWNLTYEYRSMAPGGSNQACNGETIVAANVPLLMSVLLPAAVPGAARQVYSMADPAAPQEPYYHMVSNGCAPQTAGCTAYPKNGHLKGMQLPTRGWLEWDYDPTLFFSTQEGLSRSIAVTKRRMMNSARTQTAEWTYGRRASNGRSCIDPITQERRWSGAEQLVVSVTSPAPEQVTTVHYFSRYDENAVVAACSANTVDFKAEEYGLPLSRANAQTIHGIPHYLSQETFKGTLSSLETGPDSPQGSYRVAGANRVRSEWVAYDVDADSWGSGQAGFNSRQTTQVTRFDDDSGCGGATCYSGTVHRNFDDAGHFRQSSTFGNFPAAENSTGNYRTMFTAFPQLVPGGTWLLNLYTERCSVDESSFRTTTVSGCSGLVGAPSVGLPVVTKACFDSNTGFLTRTRSLQGASPSQQDVIAVFSNDGHGNVASESYYGGDSMSVNASADCSATVVATGINPRYSIQHSYAAGGVEWSKYAGVPYKSVDNTIDVNTGLVQTTRDSAGVATTFNYDSLGRFRSVTRPGESIINYEFAEAQGNSPASVTVKQESNGPNTGSTPEERTVRVVTLFDGFGRITEEQRTMPAGTAKQRTEYTESGWTKRISEWEADPSHFTTFSDFDAFGRARTIQKADLTQSKVEYSGTLYGGTRQVSRTVCVATDPNSTGCQNKTTVETYDRLGRLIQVVEPDTISTTDYVYDVADRLVKVSMRVGADTQVRTFEYDGRGFLKKETHPESGTTSYDSYDARGHAGRKLVGAADSQFDLMYEYDAAERLVAVKDPPSRSSTLTDAADIKRFTFSLTNSGSDYSAGKLVTALRRNYTSFGVVDVTERYKYENPLGRVSSKETTVSGAGVTSTYTQWYTYNDLGLLASTTYPSCGLCGAPAFSVTPTFRNGLLRSITNFANTIEYDLNGMVTKVTHPGGIEDVVTVDSSKMPRPSRIEFNSYDVCTVPTIAHHPASQQIAAGSQATVSVVAGSGTAPLTYQWFKDDSDIPMSGETGSSCCATSGGITASGRYRARVINECGTALSQTAVIKVCGTPTINSQPQNQQIASGSSASLSVAATACEPASYQWYRGNVGDTGTPAGTGPNINTGPLTATASYWVRVTDSTSGWVNSTAAQVTVCGTPTITTQPHNASYSGTPIALTVAADGCGPFTYQWYRANVVGDTTNPVGNSQSFVVPPITVTTKYWVRVTDVGGSVNSEIATITALCTPTIAAHPAPDTTYSGSPITLSVSATGGCPPYQYQWYRGQIANRTQPVGDNSPLFTPPPPTATTYYWVLVTDSSGGEADSNLAAIHCAPPILSVQPGSMFYPGSPVTLTATPNGCGPFNYAWYSGLSGNTDHLLTSGTSASSYTTQSLTATARYWVRVRYDTWSVWVDSSTITLTVPLPAPAPLTATVSGNQINVSWGPSAGVDHYELQRLSGGVWMNLPLTPPTATSYQDTAVVPNATYVYRVRAVDSLGESASPYSSDLATTMTFTALEQNVTRIEFSHFDQIRAAINLIRAARGDGDLTWPQLLLQAGYGDAPPPAQNALIKAIHLLALRDGMTKARAAVQLTTQGYTDSLVGPTPIRAVHLTELQQRAQ